VLSELNMKIEYKFISTLNPTIKKTFPVVQRKTMTVEIFYTTVVLSLLTSLKSKNVVNQLVAICARKKEWDPDSSSSSSRKDRPCMHANKR
jgi:hypothetical protein